MDYNLLIKQMETQILPHLSDEVIKATYLKQLKQLKKFLEGSEFKLKRTIQDKQITTNILENTILDLRKQRKNLSRQKALTEEQVAFKEQLFASISHELRTPLHGILGMSHLLENTALDKEQKEFVDIIRSSADNLLIIINDILNLSKINASKTILLDENTISALEIPLKWQEKNILIIEDNEANLVYAQNLFSNGKVPLDIAKNLSEATKKIHQKKYDCILSDVKLPDGNGMEFIAKLRSNENALNQQTPIIVLTASANEKEAQYAKKLHVQNYISKPFPPQLLISELAKVFKSAPTASVLSTPDFLPALKSSSYFDSLDKNFKRKPHLQLEMLDIFLEQLPQAIEAMKNGLEKNDLKVFHYHAHRIKSTINIIGLPKLKPIILKLDEYCYQEIHLDQLPTLYKEFKKQATEDVAVILARKEALLAANYGI